MCLFYFTSCASVHRSGGAHGRSDRLLSGFAAASSRLCLSGDLDRFDGPITIPMAHDVSLFIEISCGAHKELSPWNCHGVVQGDYHFIEIKCNIIAPLVANNSPIRRRRPKKITMTARPKIPALPKRGDVRNSAFAPNDVAGCCTLRDTLFSIHVIRTE